MSKPVRLPFYIPGPAVVAAGGHGDASGNIVGPWINLETFDNVGCQAVWGDGVVGTFLAEVSEDQQLSNDSNTPDGRLGPCPLTLPDSMTVPAAIPAGTAGKFYFGFNQIEARWIRFSFIAGGGSTGDLDVGASAKGL